MSLIMFYSFPKEAQSSRLSTSPQFILSVGLDGGSYHLWHVLYMPMLLYT
jgi:hypothetical protein